MLFEQYRRRKIDHIIQKIRQKDLVKRYSLLCLGCFIVAFAFNIFFLQHGIVCFGVSGLSIVLNEFGIPPSTFIMIANVLLLIVSYFALGWNTTKDSIVGSLIFPLFVSLTELFIPYIKLEGVELIVIAIFGAVITGIGTGIIFKTGFTTGGTDILNQIIAKYSKISLGKSMIIIDGLVVLSGKLVFSWEIILYGFIVLYIISTLTDKVILGISQSKAFYIITNHEKEAKEYLLNVVGGGVTIIKAQGGYTNKHTSILLTVIPTNLYYVVKEGLQEIDPHLFFLVCDAYEVSSHKTEPSKGAKYEKA